MTFKPVKTEEVSKFIAPGFGIDVFGEEVDIKRLSWDGWLGEVTNSGLAAGTLLAGPFRVAPKFTDCFTGVSSGGLT